MRTHRHHGFTLVELLLVLVVIMIVAGIALPQYKSTKQRAYDSRVSSAVRNVATGQEAYFATRQRYASSPAELDAMVSDGVAIEITAGNSGDMDSSFRVQGSHPNAAHMFTWVSDPPPGSPHLIEN